jgi:hypothetical protein
MSVAATIQRKGRQAAFKLGFDLICANIVVREETAALRLLQDQEYWNQKLEKKASQFFTASHFF